jgi:protein TonB
MKAREEESKNRVIAFFTTTGIQVLLIVLSFFIIGWRAPDPPWEVLDPGGIELNFGTDKQGYGDVQPTEPIGNNGDQPEESKQPQPEETKAVEKQPEVREAAKPVETKATDEKILASKDEESPVAVKEKKDEVKEKPKEKPEEKKPEVKPETKPEVKVEPVKPKVDSKAVYTPPSNSTAQAEGDNDGKKEGKPGNHGDDPGKTGDKGNPQGTLDSKALYGSPGSGGGTGGGTGIGLELSGWAWDEKPNPKTPNNETGRLVFEIEVDQDGNVIKVTTLQRGVSAEAERICRNAVQELTFSKTGANVPDKSVGKVTFVFRSR